MTLALKLVAKCQGGRLDGGVGRAEEWCRSSKAGHRGGNQFARWGRGGGRRQRLEELYSRVWSSIFLLYCIVHIHKSNTCSL